MLQSSQWPFFSNQIMCNDQHQISMVFNSGPNLALGNLNGHHLWLLLVLKHIKLSRICFWQAKWCTWIHISKKWPVWMLMTLIIWKFESQLNHFLLYTKKVMESHKNMNLWTNQEFIHIPGASKKKKKKKELKMYWIATWNIVQNLMC